MISRVWQWILQQKEGASTKKAYWLSLCIWFVLTHIPAERLPKEPYISDKAVHFFGYFIIAVLAFWSYPRSGGRRSKLTMILVLFAAFDEWTQGFFRRFPNVDDFVYDTLGILVGMALVFAVEANIPPKSGQKTN